jgi:hypothetical protein
MLINKVSLHDIIINVWYAVSATRIIGTFFVRPQIHTDMLHTWIPFLSTFVQPRKSAIDFVMSVHISAYINEAPTGQIPIKFDIGNFYESLLRKRKFG